MTEEISYIPEPPETFAGVPEKKNKKTLWIILIIVAVLLICCCVAVLVTVLAGWFSFDTMDFTVFSPYLSLV